MLSDISDNYPLLAASARTSTTSAEREIIYNLAGGINDWNSLVAEAEAHAVAPLLYRGLRDSGFSIPVEAKRKLYALVQRTGWANEVRADALTEIIKACRDKDLSLAVLKGSFLAHSMYPNPSLRTMSDIDLLAPPAQARAVQVTLAELGYSVPDHALSRYMSDHHHLPGASIQRDGLTVSVEVHHDALSGDAPASITFENLTAPLQEFSVNDETASALGHQDQLRHLFHHMSEPASRLKLIWCTDIVYYARHFHAHIDWPALRRDYPAVVNALSVVDAVLPLPQELEEFRTGNKGSISRGMGQSIQPLSTLLRRPPAERFSGLFLPSRWWMHLYYGINPGKSLTMTHLVRHPLRMLQWVYRRFLASYHSRKTGSAH